MKALGLLRPSEALLLIQRTERIPKGVGHEFGELDKFSQASFDNLEKGERISGDNFGVAAGAAGVKVEKVSVAMLEVGDIVRVQTGSTPPADGTIVSGDDSAFDESSLTGESRLIKKSAGDKVFLGTINKSKMVDVRIDAVGGLTMWGRSCCRPSIAALTLFRQVGSHRESCSGGPDEARTHRASSRSDHWILRPSRHLDCHRHLAGLASTWPERRAPS